MSHPPVLIYSLNPYCYEVGNALNQPVIWTNIEEILTFWPELKIIELPRNRLVDGISMEHRDLILDQLFVCSQGMVLIPGPTWLRLLQNPSEIISDSENQIHVFLGKRSNTSYAAFRFDYQFSRTRIEWAREVMTDPEFQRVQTQFDIPLLSRLLFEIED